MSPRLPGSSNSAPPRDRSSGTVLALIFMLGMAGGFVGLVAMMMPSLIWGVVLMAGVAGTIALHYFTWGRWLMRQPRPSDSDEISP